MEVLQTSSRMEIVSAAGGKIGNTWDNQTSWQVRMPSNVWVDRLGKVIIDQGEGKRFINRGCWDSLRVQGYSSERIDNKRELVCESKNEPKSPL